jgi:hypothetical protein
MLEIANPWDAASRLDDDEKASIDKRLLNTLGETEGIPRGRGNGSSSWTCAGCWG